MRASIAILGISVAVVVAMDSGSPRLGFGVALVLVGTPVVIYQRISRAVRRRRMLNEAHETAQLGSGDSPASSDDEAGIPDNNDSDGDGITDNQDDDDDNDGIIDTEDPDDDNDGIDDTIDCDSM